MKNDRLDDVKGTNATLPKVTPPAMPPPKSQTSTNATKNKGSTKDSDPTL